MVQTYIVIRRTDGFVTFVENKVPTGFAEITRIEGYTAAWDYVQRERKKKGNW